MKVNTAVWLLTLPILLSPPGAGAAAPDLLFPGAQGKLRLRLEIRIDGQSPEAAWEAFLDSLLDYFDRDGDGSLGAAEAARVFRLPLPGGRAAAIDFGKLDANRDNKGSRAELKRFYRQAGFAPVVVTLAPPTVESLRLSEALFRHLDRDGDGRLTGGELDKASQLFRRLDENEDEVLTASDLSFGASIAGVEAPSQAAVEAAAPNGATPDGVLCIALGEEQQPPSLAGASAKRIQAVVDRPGGPFRLRVADGYCAVAPVAGKAGAAFQATGPFYLAQFQTALGDQLSVEKNQLEQDASLRALAGLFEHADRDGDGRLTMAELKTFLGLIEQGLASQVTLTVTDRGRSLFDYLDADQDGRLDVRELTAVRRRTGIGEEGVRRDQVPRQFHLTAGRGGSGGFFGPVLLGSQRTGPPTTPTAGLRCPRWFRGMDRNSDNYLSPREFLGSPDLFRRLDTDGDGLISVEEAERADGPDSSPPAK
jgi:Ca2+-binding EF-hand superfamily protein